MKSHEFSIIASGLDPEAPDFETRFFEAGCDDATIAFQKGHIIVDFTREAESSRQSVFTHRDTLLEDDVAALFSRKRAPGRRPEVRGAVA